MIILCLVLQGMIVVVEVSDIRRLYSLYNVLLYVCVGFVHEVRYLT